MSEAEDRRDAAEEFEVVAAEGETPAEARNRKNSKIQIDPVSMDIVAMESDDKSAFDGRHDHHNYAHTWHDVLDTTDDADSD